jgi:hypothetical protein
MRIFKSLISSLVKYHVIVNVFCLLSYIYCFRDFIEEQLVTDVGVFVVGSIRCCDFSSAK